MGVCCDVLSGMCRVLLMCVDMIASPFLLECRISFLVLCVLACSEHPVDVYVFGIVIVDHRTMVLKSIDCACPSRTPAEGA